VVVGAATVAAVGPEKGVDNVKHSFDILGAVMNILGKRKNEVAQSASSVSNEITVSWQQLVDSLQARQLSEDQQKALEILKNTPPEKLIHNLQVGPDGARLRSDPNSIDWSGDQINDKTNYLKTLAAGTSITEALEVEGNDPDHPKGENLTSKWYFIPTPDRKNGAFAWSKNFKTASAQSSENPK
jgi:hypothetical protein